MRPPPAAALRADTNPPGITMLQEEKKALSNGAGEERNIFSLTKGRLCSAALNLPGVSASTREGRRVADRKTAAATILIA